MTRWIKAEDAGEILQMSLRLLLPLPVSPIPGPRRKLV